MDNIFAIKKDLVGRMRSARKKVKWSQTELARRSGVSLGSVKRFEYQYKISLNSLVKIATALGYEREFEQLFAKPNP